MNSFKLTTLSLLTAALCQTPATAQTENAFPFAIASQMAQAKPGFVRMHIKADGPGLCVVLASFSPALEDLPGLPGILFRPYVLLVEPLFDGDRMVDLDLPLLPGLDYFVQAVLLGSDGDLRANAPVPVSDQMPELAGILSETQAMALGVQLKITSYGKLFATFEAPSDGYAWLPVEVDLDNGCADVYLTLKTPGEGEGNFELAEDLATSTWLQPDLTKTMRIFFGVAGKDGKKTEYVLLKKLPLNADAAVK